MKNKKEQINKIELSSKYGKLQDKNWLFNPNQLYGKPKNHDLNSMYPKTKPSN